MNQTTNTNTPAGIDLDRDQVLELMIKNDMVTQIGYRALMDGDSLDADLNFLTRLVQFARRSTSESDDNAPWLRLAHVICADAGIPPGRIDDRLGALHDKLEADRAATSGSDGTAAANAGDLDALVREYGNAPVIGPGRTRRVIMREIYNLAGEIFGDSPTATSGRELADERAPYSQDEVIELLRAAGIPDSNLRSLYAGHGLTLYLGHLTTFANTIRAAVAQQTRAPAKFVRAGWFLYEGIEWVATSSDDPRATILYRCTDAENVAAPAPAAQDEQDAKDAALPVELMGVREEMASGSGFWSSCSGCYDTEDGHPTGNYSYSSVFGCALGSGCSECGGIGAVWDNTDYEAMAKDWDKDEDRAAMSQSKTQADEGAAGQENQNG